MFKPPDHYQNLSLLLSEVLDEIGVNQEVVMKRRRAWMLTETMTNIQLRYLQSHNKKVTAFHFGSQTEGSTTEGLNSDHDMLQCFHDCRLIQDLCDWEPVPDKFQLLMIQDDTTSPGYCLLQLVKPNEALPMQDFNDEHFSTDDRGRVLMRHSMIVRDMHDGSVRHGPAEATYSQYFDVDLVPAIHCLSWPKESNAWLQQQNASGWPTEDMKRYSAEQGCLVVPVDSKSGVYPGLEWRISTSLAERCLMWSLNITQMRCYILMKMIVKKFLKPVSDEAISSFMCKTIVFHSIANFAANSTWNDSSLLSWLNQCLQTLFHCILTENCPHFITPANNLLAGKLSAEVKHKLVDMMFNLTGNIEQQLLGIDIDDLGQRVLVKIGGISRVFLKSENKSAALIVSSNIRFLTIDLLSIIKGILDNSRHNSVYKKLTSAVSKLCRLHYDGSGLERVAINLLTPFLCNSIGSIIASVEIQSSRVISPIALNWFSLGLNSHVSNGRLKLASAFYCAGDLLKCEIILADVLERMSQTPVVAFCYCTARMATYTDAFQDVCYEKKNEDVIKYSTSFCVQFLPCEVNCIPEELKYEMFRSTEEDRPYRGGDDDWMDWAVVDSLPYLHFLQYKVYSQLQRQDDKLRALHNLAETINTEDSLGHKETALNLLGQCMEQENRMQDSLFCYTMSLNIRERNNAAKLHICKVLARQLRQ